MRRSASHPCVAGEGPDRVSLVDVTPTAFDRLTATSVSGQLGDDELIGSEIRDDLIGGGGVDSLRGEAVAITSSLSGRRRDDRRQGSRHDRFGGDGDWKINDARSRLVQADEITTLGSISIAAVTGDREPT